MGARNDGADMTAPLERNEIDLHCPGASRSIEFKVGWSRWNPDLASDGSPICRRFGRQSRSGGEFCEKLY
jgi:hypothetical protein